jgi:hypothetical protein
MVLAKATVENLKKWCPNHQPVLTAVEVRSLWGATTGFEVEVEAVL